MQRIRKLSSSITDLLLARKKPEDVEADNKSTSNTPDFFQVDGKNPLHLAVAINDLVKVQELLDSGEHDVDDEDSKGRTPLQIAVLGQNPKIVQLLIEQNSCVDHADLSAQTTAAHLAVKHDRMEHFQLLLDAGANFGQEDKYGKTAFDLVCELGNLKMLNELIEDGVDQEVLLRVRTTLRPKISAIHLAARNGHVEVIYKLLDRGFDINLTTDQGTALHEAVIAGQVQVENRTAKMLAEVNCERRSIAGCLIYVLLQQYPVRIYGVATEDFEDPDNSSRLSFKKGTKIWIVDRSAPRYWKGIVFQREGRSKSGFFPPHTIRIDEVCTEVVDAMPGMNTMRGKDKMTMRKMKRAELPNVPPAAGVADISRRSRHYSSGSYPASPSAPPTEYSALEMKTSCHSSSSCSSSRAPSSCSAAPPDHSDYSTLGDFRLSGGHHAAMTTSTRSYGTSTFQTKPAVPSPSVCYAPIPLNNRNSTGSSCSQSSSGFESAKTLSNVGPSNSTASFNSTSGISDGSPANSTESMPKVESVRGISGLQSTLVGRLGHLLAAPLSNAPSSRRSSCNIADMIARGIPDSEILGEWLERMDMQKYLHLPPSSLGITNPADRKKLHSSIQEWRDVGDTWPTNVQPDENASMWLMAIGLQQYIRLFENEGYLLMKDLESLSFEDLEEIGVKKLGHIKRIMLSLRKLKQARTQNILAGRKPSSSALFHSPDSGYTDISGSSSAAHRSRAPFADLRLFGADADPYNMPKLRIVTAQEILSATTDLPRSVNGEIMNLPHLSTFGSHRSAPPPPPAPIPSYQPSYLPPMPQSARASMTPSFDLEATELNARHGRSLHGSPLSARGPYSSQPTTPSRYLTSFIANGTDAEQMRNKMYAMTINK
ncbi:hypothetical protein M3Y99_00503400 [Aphelenchoides fujianensis]|nr:hypothetical protein M3Y99_00503400 [Aphelenchoides fujianensis]